MKLFALTGDLNERQSRIRRAEKKLVCALIRAYVKLVESTVRLVIENEDCISDNVMAGYWHEDCTGMYLVLNRLAKKFPDIAVIVTADERGDFIEDVIRHYGARALRMPDGIKMRKQLPDLIREAKNKDTALAAALDGPLGPLHEPKKLLFLLAKEADKEVCYFRFRYSHVLRSKKRWDHYAYPLPFTKIVVTAENLGRVSAGQLKEFQNYKEKFSAA